MFDIFVPRKPTISRRSFLGLGLVAAPAIVSASSLMKIVVPKLENPCKDIWLPHYEHQLQVMRRMVEQEKWVSSLLDGEGTRTGRWVSAESNFVQRPKQDIIAASRRMGKTFLNEEYTRMYLEHHFGR